MGGTPGTGQTTPTVAAEDQPTPGAAAEHHVRRRFRTVALISAAVTAGLAVWLQFNFGGTLVTQAVDDVVETLAPLAAVVAWWWAVRHRPRKERRAWMLLGAACGSWGLGQGIWTYLEVIRHTQPFPSLADPLYLAFVPLSAAALLAFVGASPGVWWRVRPRPDRPIPRSAAPFCISRLL